MSDSNSPKEQDRRDEQVAVDEAVILENRNNNEPNYVANRLLAAHRGGQRLKFGSQLLTLVVNSANPGASLEAGPGNKGVIAVFEDFDSMQKGRYLVETNGLNGVMITHKIADLNA